MTLALIAFAAALFIFLLVVGSCLHSIGAFDRDTK